MYKITFVDFQKKLKEYDELVDIEGEFVTCTCPNGIIKERGKPTIVWAFYNGRKYSWELQE